MNLVILVWWLFWCIDSATGTQCLSCASMPSSVPCVTATTCSTGQECYAKYVLKPDGTVMYEFGCQDSQTCPGHVGTHALIGKRATGDVELCYKCCQGDMCNQGTLCTGPATTVKPIVVPTTMSSITTVKATTTPIPSTSTTVITTTSSATARTIPTTIGGDVCLACSDSPLTRECLYTMTCESHESCYADAFENPNGDIVFNLGCRDRQLCGAFGKRGVVNRSNGNTHLCAQCCFGNLCNAALCGQTGLPSVGPVCFKCDQALTPSSCNTIALCGRDDVCHVEKTIGSLTHATLYKSGCLHKTQCDRNAAQSLSLIGRKRYDNTVISGNDLQIQCCDSNLCNHGNASSASGSVLTTGTMAPTHSSLSTHPSMCSSNPCVHGNCFSGSTDYMCQCDQGWQGKRCDQQISLCTSNPCLHGTCVDVASSYVCQCSVGWQGTNCDQKINHCTTNPCLHGTCSNGASSYACQCSAGWQGTDCDQKINYCTTNPCLHGTCSNGASSYACQCSAGWQGTYCDQKINFCSSNPCLHGTCLNGASRYVCQCSIGWQGTDCDQKINFCSSNPCLHGTCLDGTYSYVCQCSVGWQGTDCDQKINYCTNNHCVHGTCSNGASSYVCHCSVGWQGKNCDQMVTPKPTQVSTGCKRDVVFVFDESNSIGESNFRLSTKYAGEILDQMHIGNGMIHTAAIYTYSAIAQVVWGLKNQTTLTNMKSSLHSLTFHGGVVQSTGFGLSKVYTSVFTHANGDRSDADNVIIMFTDGNTIYPVEMQQWVTRVKSITSHVFMVAMDMVPGFNLQTLTQWASDTRHVIRPYGATSISKDVPYIMNVLCQ